MTKPTLSTDLRVTADELSLIIGCMLITSEVVRGLVPSRQLVYYVAMLGGETLRPLSDKLDVACEALGIPSPGPV